ncbi:MAG: BamA/TamA family outer membrane protein [Prevotella sp.]|nr:BamA/TamA family outer membrane protein [Prevotella sp.]MBQ9186687.1 BamA/TamA family outer membrane protein [Prevotella sp.]
MTPIKRNILLATTALLLTACSMTKNIPEGDQLFTGLKAITYQQPTAAGDSITPADIAQKNYATTKEEVEAALATAPNGAIFGSSYYRMPFSIRVAIWNKYANKESAFARWMTKSLGKQPVLMSWVNPELRASVARSVLRNHGYFNGRVGYETITQKNPKTAKIAYDVQPGRLYTLDSVGWFGFPAEADSLIRSTADDTYIRKGDAFVVSNLEAERNRISTLLRNNGYYYYQPGYASYLADTVAVDGRVQLRFQLANGIPPAATRKWAIGRININMRKTFMEQPTDSFRGRFFTIRFAGKKPPIRPRVLMADLKLRPRQLYSYDNYVESASKINAMGLFSMADFTFTPRTVVNDSVANSLAASGAMADSSPVDTLDLTLNCVFDKPWDFYVETNFNARTIGRMGPELKMGLTRRNAFRGGEKIDVNIHGSYEWATSKGSTMNNYEYGADASVEFPRIIAPFFGGNRIRRDKQGRIIRRRRFYSTPSTLAKLSTDIIYRPSYYKMHVVAGEWTYRWQTSQQSRHEFSPLTVKYQFMNSHTTAFNELVMVNPYLAVTMQDYFIPEMRYTYTYSSPSAKLNPIRWETTFSEAGNAVSLGYLMSGKKWDEKNKKLFKNPYSQFLKLETDFTKTWRLGQASRLVAHVNAGYIWVYGNSDWLPNSELFYVGGANSIRAFAVRGIGPGNVESFGNKALDYMARNGNIKFVGNLEYRRQLFGNLHGAIFLDAGNVWTDDDDAAGAYTPGSFHIKNFLREMAVGTGIGIRYDLDFLILRLDWGIGLHVPYDTGKSGFYNMPNFKNSHTLNFAIGYPF